MAGDELFVDPPDKWGAYVIFNNKWIESSEERSERSAKGCGEGSNEVPSRGDEHRVVFCSFFRRFFGFVLIRILLADSLLFEYGSG